MIKQQLERLKIRGLPEKQTKYSGIKNHLSCENKKKLYDYYICDNCGCEIPIKQKWERSLGGVIYLPKELTKRHGISIAVCNKCLNSVLKEFEE